MKYRFTLFASLVGASCLHAAPINYWSQAGNHSTVNGALDGATVADQLGLNSYNGFIGELVVMPTDASRLSGVASGTSGMVTADSDGIFSGKRGLAGYCIDSATSFNVSTSLGETYTYESYSYVAANARYLSENVAYYNDGGLKRAAYLMETFYATAHTGGDLEAAALQAAIWEVLYDGTPSVTLNSGDYFIRTNTGNNAARNLAAQVRNQANTWLGSAAAAGWGGASYDPGNNVLFWLNPTALNINQSIITLNPTGSAITAVPEPRSWVVIAAGVGMLGLVRRRS